VEGSGLTLQPTESGSGLTLHIAESGRHHAGLYTCQADNGWGELANATVSFISVSAVPIHCMSTGDRFPFFCAECDTVRIGSLSITKLSLSV